MSRILDALRKLDREKSVRRNGPTNVPVEILRPYPLHPIKKGPRYFPDISFKGVVRIFAWVDLFAGIIASIWVWSQFERWEVAQGLGHLLSNPFRVVIGIAVLLQGVFSCVFLLLTASIAENLVLVKKYSDKKEKQCPECAEEIRVEARVCRFCGHRFAPPRPRLVSIETLSPIDRVRQNSAFP